MPCWYYQRVNYALPYSGYTQKLRERSLGGKIGANYRRESAEHCARKMH
jgi:hypothetical protein